MKKQFVSQTLVLTLSFLVSFALVPQASAEDNPSQSVDVSGNAAHSENDVQTNNSSETHVESNNSGEFHNEVKTESNTGGNSAGSNTGGSSTIVTGDAKTVTDIKNTANNTVVDAGNCCQNQSSSTTVSGNGAGSQNTATSSNTSNTSVSVNNNATIVNNVSIKANTGNNSANFNTGGNTIIKTGDIRTVTAIDNGPVNTAKVKLQENGNTSLSSYLKIAGNGVFSENNITERNKNFTNIHVDNIASIYNNVDSLLNTGNNNAEFNVGGYTIIVTGNIDAKTLINNVANFSLVEVVCGCEKKPHKPHKPLTPNEEIPHQPSAPTPPTTSVGGPGPGPSAPGPGAPASTTLPVTGNNILFFMLANVMMLILGTYLRLRSGRSPGSLN